MQFSLADLASKAGIELHGDAACMIQRVATIEEAGAGDICFLANRQYARHLPATSASAVILQKEFVDQCPTNALISENPYLAYARVAALLYPESAMQAGIDPTAVVHPDANIDPTASIAACVVVEAGALVGARAVIGPGCVIGSQSKIGEDSVLKARVTICESVSIGKRVVIHPGAVIGSDGFGNANDNGRWVKVPQLGRVIIENDVEIGANTTIDRGSLRDTVIEEGARLDNQIQIAHNVRIGAHTALAGCVGIAGSTTVGKYCTLGGGVGLSGHLEIGDNVHFTGQSLVTRSVKEPGIYSGNLPAVPNNDWRKTIARIRHIDEMAKKLKRLERELQDIKQLDSKDND